MIVVVKLGGSLLEDEIPDHFIDDVKKVSEGKQLVIIHGGREVVNKVSSKMGKEQQFIISPGGFRSRYTDKETMEIFTMALAGKVNKKFVASLLRHNLKAVGLSGIDGSLARAERKRELVTVDERGRKRIIDGGYTGKIENVDTQILRLLIEEGYIPVISPIALGEDFEELNIDGDRMASYIASGLKADALILLTDVDGVMVDGRIQKQLTLNNAKNLISKTGHGMITKLYAATEALERGVKQVIIASGLDETPLTSALNRSAGTLIINE